jgi:hypothetical protein
MAGLQAQASTANVAQAQKAEAFTPSGRLQRQGFQNIEQLEQFAAHIQRQIERHNEMLQEIKNNGRIPLLGNLPLNKLPFAKKLSFPYLKSWKETLEKLNEAIAFHQKLNAQPSNSGLMGFLSAIKQQFTHPYLSHKYRLKNLGRYINLPQMEFLGLDLSGATLDGANFTGASFAGADLYEASLRNTNLVGTNFNDASLYHTAFEGAEIGQPGSSNPTIFHGATVLKTTRGLPKKGIDTSAKSLEEWLDRPPSTEA